MVTAAYISSFKTLSTVPRELRVSIESATLQTQSPCTLPYGKNKDKRFIVKTVAFM
jgi:hypothetical protein